MTSEAQQHRSEAAQLPDGDIVAVLLRQHADITELNELETDTTAFGTKFAEFAEKVHEHAEHEEHEEFPSFDALSTDERRRLGSDFLEAFESA